MSYQNCIDSVRKAVGEENQLTDKQLEQVFTQLDKHAERIMAAGNVVGYENAVRMAADEITTKLKVAAAVEKRNAAINARVRLEAASWVKANWTPERYGEGLVAFMLGTQKNIAGGRLSVWTSQMERQAKYLGGLTSDLARADLIKVFSSGALDRDVSRALWSLDTPDAKFDGPEEALAIAKVVRKYQDLVRTDMNRAGAWIGKTENYIVRQSHDAVQIKAKGWDAWRENISSKLDWAKIEAEQGFFKTDLDRENWLKQTWNNLASGVHLRTTTGGGGVGGGANLASKLSSERVLHFKTADDWFDYNQAFGSGTIRDSVTNAMDHAAKSVGLMRSLGTNPEANLKNIMRDLSKQLEEADPGLRQKFSDAQAEIGRALKTVDGTIFRPANASVARMAAGTRKIQDWAKLGGMLLSQFSDIPVFASEAKFQGMSFLGGIGHALKGLAMSAKAEGERLRIMSSVGVFYDSFGANLTMHTGGMDAQAGMMSKMDRLFYKLNLSEWWNTAMRQSAGDMFAHRLHLEKGAAWAELDPDLSRTLGLFGIDEPKWNAIRNAADDLDQHGRGYLTPDAMQGLKDEHIDPLIADRVAKIKQDTADVVAKLDAANERELGWLDSRLKKFAEAKEKALAALDKYVGAQEGKVAAESERATQKGAELYLKMEQAGVEADIAKAASQFKGAEAQAKFMDRIRKGMEDYGSDRMSSGERLGWKARGAEDRMRVLEKRVERYAKESAGKESEVSSRIAKEESWLDTFIEKKQRGIERRLDQIKAALNKGDNAKADYLQGVSDRAEDRIDVNTAEFEAYKARLTERLGEYKGRRDKLPAEDKARIELVEQKLEVAQAKTDVAAYLNMEKRWSRIEQMARDLDWRNRNVGERQFDLGERLGRRKAVLEQRIKELDQRAQAKADAADEAIGIRTAETTAKINARIAELETFTKELVERREKRQKLAETWQSEVGSKIERERANARDDLEEALRSYYVDRIHFAQLSPDAQTQSFLLRGTQPGTAEGELLRFIGQYKSFPTAFVQKVLGREFYGRRGLEQPWGFSEVAGIARLVIAMTGFGYGSMAAKDLVKGRNPRSLMDPGDDKDGIYFLDTPWVNEKTLAAALAQGGGLGIYGDFLFGADMRNRNSGGLLSTLAGPVLGSAEAVMDIVGRVRAGEDPRAAAAKLAISNTPFVNMFYTKLTFDYFVTWNLMEMVNPGSVNRMERKVEKENATTFWLSPSSAVR